MRSGEVPDAGPAGDRRQARPSSALDTFAVAKMMPRKKEMPDTSASRPPPLIYRNPIDSHGTAAMMIVPTSSASM
jgi:hypothetical protein